MRIALVINELNIKGGTHKQLVQLAQYLVSQGHSVNIFTKFYSSSLYPLRCDNLKVIDYESYFSIAQGRWIRQIRKLQGSIKMARDISSWAEIVNIHDNWLLIPNIYLKLFSPNLKVVWQINDLHPAFGEGNSKVGKPLWYYGFTRKAAIWCAAKNELITVNVSKNKQRVKAKLEADAVVVYCGVDLKNTSFIPRHISISSTINLLSVGVFFPYRNYEAVLEVQRTLQSVYGLVVKTNIVGSTVMAPEYAKKIETIIHKENIDAQVRGQVSDEELNKLFKEASFFLFLNVDQSWGLAVFEAMNYSLPVVVSNSVGAVELLTEDKNAIINDPFDTERIAARIYELITAPDRYHCLSKTSYHHVENMTWVSMYCIPMEKLLQQLNSN